MHLQDFSLLSPKIQSKEVLRAIEAAIPATAIEQAIAKSKAREVVQEIYGWLLGHWSVRVLMFQAATTAGVPPLRLSFTGTLRVICRAIAKFQDLQPEEFPFFSIG